MAVEKMLIQLSVIIRREVIIHVHPTDGTESKQGGMNLYPMENMRVVGSFKGMEKVTGLHPSSAQS